MKKVNRFWALPLIMGTIMLFTSSCEKEKKSTAVTDADGNEYNTLTIGTQSWLATNLKTTRYQNGDLIGTSDPLTLDISLETNPKYQWAYDGNQSNADTYGRLYTWYAATDIRNICPTGWRLPTDEEWTTLATFLGGETDAGGKLKETATTHWESPNTAATNEVSFTALPGGYHDQNGENTGMGNYGYWWSSTGNTMISAWNRSISYGSGALARNSSFQRNGLSVRCIKN